MHGIDFHAHFTPQQLLRSGGEAPDAVGTRLEQIREIEGNRDVRGPEIGPVEDRKNGTKQRLLAMDDVNTHIQVVSLTPSLMKYDLAPTVASKTVREVNEEISRMKSGSPDRFRGLGTLPLPDVEASVAELDYVMTVLGLEGVQLDTQVNGRNWDEPEFDPIFERAERLGAIVFFHASYSMPWRQISPYGLADVMGESMASTLVIAALIFGGVFDRHPSLKVVIAYGGGSACFGMGRMQRGWQVKREARINIRRPPQTYLRRMFYDSLTWSESTLRFLIDTVGADRVLMGSDWPTTSGPDSPVNWLGSLESLSQRERDLIQRENAELLLDIAR